MANTIAGANLAAIAEMSLQPLQSALLPLRAFTTDFSSDIAQRGASVTTRYATNPTAQALSTFIQPAAYAIAKKVFGDLWNLANDTNYPAVTATELTVTAANFDRDDVADIAQQLTTNGVSKTGRSLILAPGHYAALAKDLNAVDSAGQSITIGENVIPRLHGFDVYESPECDGNGVNVAGLATGRQGMLMAARSVDIATEATRIVDFQNVVLPDLGLPVQFRKWYDPSTGYLMYSMGVLYGVKFGIPSSGLKIVTA